MKKIIASLTLALCLLLPVTVQAATALETLQGVIGEMLDVLKEPAQPGTPAYAQERQQLEKVIKNIFDFNELSARAVGLHWKRFSPEQKEQFVQAFSDLLGAKYLDRIQAYKNERVLYGEVRTSSSGNVEVQSVIVQGDKQIPIAYRMTETANGWRVYDVIIEGVSLVKNYRTQFMDIMVNGKPDELIEAVRKKASAAKSGTSEFIPGSAQGGRVICMLYYVAR